MSDPVPADANDVRAFLAWVTGYAPGATLSANAADDLVDATQLDRKRLGNLFKIAEAHGLIFRIGYELSTRPEAKGRPIAVWERTWKRAA